MRIHKIRPAVVIVLLLLAVAAVIGGSIAGNREDHANSGGAPSAGGRAEREFDRSLRYEVAEDTLEEEGYSGEEAEEAREFAEKEHVGAQGAVELGAVGKAAGSP